MNSMSVDVCTESKFRVAILEHVAVIIKSKKMPREYILFADRMIRNIDMDSLKMEDFVKEKKSFSKILLELCDIIHSSKNVEEPRLLSINAFKVLKAINFKTHSLTILHWFYLFLSLPSTKAKELPADYELSLDLLEKIVMSGNLASIQDDIVYGAAVAISILKDRGSECKDYITRLIHDLSIYTPRIEQIHLDIENILKGVRCPSKQNSIQLKRNLATFSQDILVAIFDFCDCLDKLRFTEICKHFHRTLSSQNAWKELNLSSASPASIPYSFLSKHNGSKSLKILNLTFQNLSQDLLSDLIDSCSSLKTIVLDFAFLTSHQTLKDNNGLKTKILATSLTYFSMRSLRSSEKISCALITPNLKHLNASDVSRSKCMPFVIELCSSSTCLEDVYLNNSFSSDIPLHIFYGSLQSLKKFYVNFGSPRVNSGLDNTSLRKIITCSPNLRELGVCMNSQLTDTAFSESVAYFSRLEILELGWIYDISEESLLSLSAVLRNLRSLNLCRIPSVSNTVVRSFIENCPTLRILNIRMCDHVSDEAFEGLTRFSSAPNLRTIVIEGTRVNSFRLQEKGFVCY